ncbi:MAG: DUF3078 domain-containing protein [Bacteroidota bacterium]
MIKRIGFLLVTFSLCAGISAQDAQIKNLQKESSKAIKKEEQQKEGWTKGGIFTLNLSQGASQNWAAGAEQSSFSINSIVQAFAFYKKNKISWDNTFNGQYGIVNATSIGTRKNDDRIDVLSKLGYMLDKSKWSLTLLGNIRTQFTDGFDYSTTPAKKNSAFFAPAFLLISPGINYKPINGVDIFISPITGRWIVVQQDSLRTLYQVPENKNSIYEMGAFASFQIKRDIAKNMNYVARFDLFSNYKREPQNVDVFWTNVINMKVNKYISVTYNFDLIYDHDVENVKTGGLLGTQLKSLLGVGLSAKF